MKELWLNYKDENGEPKRVLVEGEKFAIGRTPDNDLQIPINNLSRQHAKIQRFADVFIVSDCGSSNGSTLNGEPLENPTALQNGDILNLGDAVEIKVEDPANVEKDEENAAGASASDSGNDGSNESASAKSSGSAKSASASSSSTGSGALWLYMLLPILGVLVLLGLGGAILIARSQKEPEIVKNGDDFVHTSKNDDFDTPNNDDKKTPEKSETPTPAPTSNAGGTTTPTGSTSPTPDPTEVSTPVSNISTDEKKIQDDSAIFLRGIAQNDPSAFLTQKQISIIKAKINQFKGSGALAENIKDAKKNAAQIVKLANSKNLKPQFLANAALTKLGNQRGDIVAVATEMLEKLSDISKPFGNESADENLLIIAAYSNNTSGESLQTTAGTFTKNFPNPRTIRSIWFFKDKGKLDDSQFDFALKYLAIGTITQNPKSYNVSSEALVF